MSDLAPPTWVWEDHPEVALSEDCANGVCERCVRTFRDYDSGERNECGHPCHTREAKE